MGTKYLTLGRQFSFNHNRWVDRQTSRQAGRQADRWRDRQITKGLAYVSMRFRNTIIFCKLETEVRGHVLDQEVRQDKKTEFFLLPLVCSDP